MSEFFLLRFLAFQNIQSIFIFTPKKLTFYKRTCSLFCSDARLLGENFVENNLS